jgi:hypothetical protein
MGVVPSVSTTGVLATPAEREAEAPPSADKAAGANCLDEHRNLIQVEHHTARSKPGAGDFTNESLSTAAHTERRGLKCLLRDENDGAVALACHERAVSFMRPRVAELLRQRASRATGRKRLRGVP